VGKATIFIAPALLIGLFSDLRNCLGPNWNKDETIHGGPKSKPLPNDQKIVL